jgi:TM2 domain-containing membrane protein YozV
MSDSGENPPVLRGRSLDLQSAPDAGLPPHPLDKRWYAHVDGQSYGPYTGHDIRRMAESRQIKDSDFLCPEGGSSWTQAKNEPLLAPLFKAQAEQAPPQVTASNGGTVVQVTNQVPNLAHAALLLSTGDAAPKSPGVALLLSFLICGAGQMYNGQVGKGILMFLCFIVLSVVFLFWVIWLWSMIDAYSTAKTMNLRYQQRVLAGLM